MLTWRASIKEKKKREIERSYLNKKKKQELTGLSDPVYVCVVFCKKKKEAQRRNLQ